MADKKYKLTFGMSDGTQKSVTFTAPQGEPGAAGKSAYEIAKAAGYTGTEAEFAVLQTAQADFEQKNPAHPEYVKNRTHYREYIEPETLYDGSVKFINSMGSITGIDNTKLEAGKTYRVTWNGKAYDCVAYRTGDTLLGNLALMYAGDDTGEPFCLEKFSSNGSTVIKNSETAETVTLKVEIPAGWVYHKIPKEYLPDDIGGGVKVTAQVGQTIRVKAVDAKGIPTEWEAADYQPRTHWLEGREVLPETMCGLPHEDSDTTDGGVAILSNHIGLVEGESYKVTYTTEVDGTREYTCVCKKYTNVDADWLYPGDWLYLGNGIIIGGNSEYTEDPFTIAEYPNAIAESPNGMTWCVTSYPGTLSVCTSNYQMHKLPVEFLPDGVPYLAESENAEILPETKMVDDGDGVRYITEGVTAPIIGGITYTVKYNGVEYQCVAVEMPEDGVTAHILGNYAAMTGTGDTGEPFIAIVLPAEYVASWGVGGMVMSIDGSTPETIAISGSGLEIRKLDNRCLDLEWMPEKKWAGTELIPEVTATGTWRTSDMYSRDFLPYDRLIVVFDGVEYECFPQFSDDGNIENAFMNMSNVPDASLMPGENPDQKFLVFCDLNQTSLIPSDGGTHTYAIRTVEYEYSKLDNGYLGLDWLPVKGTKEIFKPTVFKHNKATYGGTIFDLTSIIVNYEGIEYSCPVRFQTAEEAAEAADVCSASNHLFALWSLRGGSSVYAYFADGKDHFLSILDGESYNQMPEGYLPESVEGVVIRSSTEGSSKKFKLTVDDSGTITATEV